MLDIVINLLITTVFGVFANYFYDFYKRVIRKEKPEQLTVAKRLRDSIGTLEKTSQDVEFLLSEVAGDLKKREQALMELQSRNEALSSQEKDLTNRISKLKNVPIEVAEYFQQINQKNLEQIDKKSGKRDLMFFILGIVASAIVAILLRVLGWA